MEEVLIKPETAVLAKQKGFDWHCQCYYKRNESLFNRSIEQDPDNWNGSSYANDVMSAPTQSLLQKYLREECNLLVIVKPWFGRDIEYVYQIDFIEIIGNSEIHVYSEDENITFANYEEALEEGLLNALTLIK